MARPRYTITTADVVHASTYLANRLRNQDVRFSDDVTYRTAERAFTEASQESRKEKRAEQVNAWCEKYLSSEEWAKFKLAIRKRRERRVRTDLKTVTITARAFEFLSKLSERDKVTYSEILEKYLLKALNAKQR